MADGERRARLQEGQVTVPSIKGAAIQSIFEDIRRLVDDGAMRKDELEVRLDPQDIELLREKLDVARWYPLTTYDRCTRLLCDHHGGDREAYLRERGRAAGRRLSASGLYPQLELADRIDAARAAARLLADVRLMVTAFGSMLSAGKLVASQDAEGRVRLEVQGAAALPEVLAHVILGMIDHLAERIGEANTPYRFERASQDVWVYTR
jgi:hypothetical protein